MVAARHPFRGEVDLLAETGLVGVDDEGAELVADLDVAATDLGYDLVLSTLTPARDERRAAEILLDFRCEALILLGPDDPAGRLNALGRELPVVVIGRRVTAAAVDVVRAADDQGVAQAVGHLAALGHRAITFVDGGRGTIASDRRRGYRRAMREHGFDGQLRIIPGDHTEEAGTRAASALLAGPDRPTAVIASNDRSAVGFLDAALRLGVRVPEALSVVGHDDSLLARLAHVDLTTVSQGRASRPARRSRWRSSGWKPAGPRRVRSSCPRPLAQRHRPLAQRHRPLAQRHRRGGLG